MASQLSGDNRWIWWAAADSHSALLPSDAEIRFHLNNRQWNTPPNPPPILFCTAMLKSKRSKKDFGDQHQCNIDLYEHNHLLFVCNIPTQKPGSRYMRCYTTSEQKRWSLPQRDPLVSFFLFPPVLGLAGMGLIFFVAVHMRLCFGFLYLKQCC